MTLKHWLFVHYVLHWCCCDTQQTRRRLLWGETSDCWRCSCPHAAPPPRPSQTVSAFHPKPSTSCQEGWHCCSLTAYQIQLQNQMKELLELFDSDSFLSEYFPTTLYYCHTQMYLFYCSCSLRNISVLFFFLPVLQILSLNREVAVLEDKLRHGTNYSQSEKTREYWVFVWPLVFFQV